MKTKQIRKRIDTNLVYINGVVYIEKSKGRRIVLKRKAPIQGSAAVNKHGRPTKRLQEWRDNMLHALRNDNQDLITRTRAESFISIADLIEAYRKIAGRSYLLSGEPRRRTVENNISSMKTICTKSGVDLSASLGVLTPDVIEAFVRPYPNKNTAWGHVVNARSLWAKKWAAPAYRKMGLKLPYYEWPQPRRSYRPKYTRPAKELRDATISLWNGLEGERPGLWAALTLALNFAVSRSDAVNMQWEQLAEGNLKYMRQKTAGRTGTERNILWPVDPVMLQRLRRASQHPVYVIPGDTDAERYRIIKEVIAELRKTGWNGYQKPYHEMRKLCVDAVYRKLGLETAVQISGDNPETVVYYYSDPRLEGTKAFNIQDII